MHYHGTPITPRARLLELAGRHFCVSYAEPRDVEVAHRIGQSVMLDNGAYSIWRDPARTVDWDEWAVWADRWLAYPTTWAVLPDSVDAATLAAWPDPPDLGMVTFVDPGKTRRKRDPGRCFLRAGFQRVGYTQSGLVALQLLPAAMPDPVEASGTQGVLA